MTIVDAILCFGLQASGKDLLVLLSDSRKLSFLTFNMDLHRFVVLFVQALRQICR